VISIESPKDSDVGELIDFGVVRIPFTPNFKNDVVVNNDTKLQIVVEAGELFLGRVELIPATDTSFNPDEFTFTAPMPKLRKRPEFFDLAVQFFDRNSNKAQYVPIKQAVKFDGENDVIQGTDNLLTGSLSIGNSIGTGIEAAGVNSAFIRSVGYVGFTSASLQGSGGFMIFSGSVLPDSPDSYEGVGLEIHDGNSGSFKFRTHNADGVGEFDVRTNKFFFGKSGSQFVSGSDDKIEISSSKFHLKNDGNVVVNGAITITGGGAQDVFDNIGSATASLLTASSSMAVQNVLTETGMSLRNPFGLVLANYGATTEIFASGSTQNKAILDGTGLAVVQGNTTRSIFGSDITLTGGTVQVRNSSTIFTQVDSTGLKVFDGDASNADAFFGGGSAFIGRGANASSGLKSQIILETVGGKTGIRVTDKDAADIAFIGESAAIASRTSAGSSLPTTNAVRGIITSGITTDQAIVTGSLTSNTITADEINITGSANVGGLVTSGSVRNTSDGSATTVMIHTHNGSNTLFQVLNDGEVLARDNITAFKTSGFSNISDKRLKTDIQPISQSLDKILKLEPKNFSWIENNEKDTGFIAQDVEKVIPEVVQETKGFVSIDSNEKEDTKYKTISYSKLTIYLVDAIKELTKRVEDLEERFVKK